MTLSPGLRKVALTAHVTSSVGWLGAVITFLALAVVGLRSRDAQAVRASYLAMDMTTRLIIVPLAFTSVLTGLISSLGTAWGLLRHYWVLAKFLLIIAATVVLLLQLAPIDHLADAAIRTSLSGSEFREARLSLVVHGGGGLLVLFTATVLSIYKPRGMTRYGQRRQNQRRTAPVPWPDAEPFLPRWTDTGQPRPNGLQ